MVACETFTFIDKPQWLCGELLWSLCILNNRYRKRGWFGQNFDFDARLRRYAVLSITAIGAILLILIISINFNESSFIFCSHCWYLFLQYSAFWCEKPQIFGFQILRVIWASFVSGQTKRIWWATLYLLYLIILLLSPNMEKVMFSRKNRPSSFWLF